MNWFLQRDLKKLNLCQLYIALTQDIRRAYTKTYILVAYLPQGERSLIMEIYRNKQGCYVIFMQFPQIMQKKTACKL